MTEISIFCNRLAAGQSSPVIIINYHYPAIFRKMTEAGMGQVRLQPIPDIWKINPAPCREILLWHPGFRHVELDSTAGIGMRQFITNSICLHQLDCSLFSGNGLQASVIATFKNHADALRCFDYFRKAKEMLDGHGLRIGETDVHVSGLFLQSYLSRYFNLNSLEMIVFLHCRSS